MIGLAALPQLLHAALASVEGAAAYIDDMNRLRGVLSTAPEPFSWWTIVYLALMGLAWIAALVAGWMFLNRRFGGLRNRPAAYAEPAGPSTSASRLVSGLRK